MKAHYKLFLSLAIGSFVTFAGCQDDEVVDLVKYPVNQPAITIDGAEGASKAMLTAVYKSDVSTVQPASIRALALIRAY